MDLGLIELYKSAFPLLLKGASITVWVSAIGIFSGSFVGSIFGILDCNKLRTPFLAPFFRIYVTIFRGTPLFVQLLIIYFALPDALGIELSPISAGIITLGLNSTAYLAEIIRAGINAVDSGQWDASYILGYSKFNTFRYIIMPQAFKNVIPAITNEFATLIKESSILMVIGVPELVKNSRDIVAHNLKPMEIYLLTAVFYLIMTYAVAFLAKFFEGKAK
ncbi:MAG: amino acid ABC transporter permease [Myxococcales bacterium]|nr:amino acid ABC transporter permease [Myxococcales bacterium]USN51667.1 MAG: amino acid ABC transporter permease [Myxococcales bacterium]